MRCSSDSVAAKASARATTSPEAADEAEGEAEAEAGVEAEDPLVEASSAELPQPASAKETARATAAAVEEVAEREVTTQVSGRQSVLSSSRRRRRATAFAVARRDVDLLADDCRDRPLTAWPDGVPG